MALLQRAFQCFNKLGGFANVAVHLHDHLNVRILDAFRIYEVGDTECNRGCLFAHRASFINLTRSGPDPTETAIRILPSSSGTSRTCDKAKQSSGPTEMRFPGYEICW